MEAEHNRAAGDPDAPEAPALTVLEINRYLAEQPVISIIELCFKFL